MRLKSMSNSCTRFKLCDSGYQSFKCLEGELNKRADIIFKLQEQNKEFQEQNKKLVVQINLSFFITSNLVNRLDEQDKRISSLLAYQKLSDWNTSNSFIITIQRLWRGYFVRKSIKMKLLELKKYLSTLCK